MAKNLTNYLNNSINEAAMQFWFVTDVDKGCSYVVCASTMDEAKSIIPSDGEKTAWLLKLKKTNEPTILFDSDQVKSYGDKKW